MERLRRTIWKPLGIGLEELVGFIALACAFLATLFVYRHGGVVAYGDAESHLNIAKRVVDSLTPGMAQLGGIWLPLPHLLMIPFVKFDFLWRTGLAGAIVSGIAFIVSAIFIYRLTLLMTEHRGASVIAALVFIANPNILYLQATPMTELALVVFFVLSSYYFIRFLKRENLIDLVVAAFFGFCATLSRYDGWFLVLIESGVLVLLYVPWSRIPRKLRQFRTSFDQDRWEKLQGRTILFAILGLLGIVLWLAWDGLILGDPLYFTHSQFSARSQQQAWLARGELPAYGHLWTATKYYLATVVANAGTIPSILAGIGFIYFLALGWRSKRAWLALLVLLSPFVFNVATLYIGQSVIFIPSLTPANFEWRLFNVRYGVLMIPFLVVLIGIFFARAPKAVQAAIVAGLVFQTGLFALRREPVITFEDGAVGLSSSVAKIPDAQYWLDRNYDHGLVLLDDYARTLSVLRTHIPMQNVIYVGNKPYWNDSLKEPEKYATWVVMQQDDAVWKAIYDDPAVQGKLFKYFQKVYTSPQILIFKRASAEGLALK